MKKLFAFGVAFILAFSMLAACAGTGTSGTTGKKEFVVDNMAEPPEMNPITTTSTGSMNVLRHMMDGLVGLDAADEPVAAAAESWELDEATNTYTFKIREASKWSNGEPVTAHDFVFGWTLLFSYDVAANYAGTWAPLILGAEAFMTVGSEEPVEVDKDTAALLEAGGYEALGFKAVDDKTLQVTTTGPYPYFLATLAFPNFFPMNEKAYNEIGADKYGKEADAFLCNGPFTMTSWAHEDSLVLEKDEKYWDAGNINLDKITYTMMADIGTRYNAFVAGEIDMADIDGNQSQLLATSGQEDAVKFFDDGSSWYFEFNLNIPGINNIKVRRALTMAVNAESFVKDIVKDHSSVATSFTPPAIKNGEHTKAVGTLIERPTDYTELVAMLKEGLAEEGLTLETFKPVLIAGDTTAAIKYSAFFQEQWKQNLGVTSEVSNMTYKSRIDHMQNYDFDIVFSGWGADYNDPISFLDIFVTGNGNNHVSYASADYDKLIADARVEADPVKRQSILIEAEKLLIEDLPVGPIYWRAKDYALNTRVTGVIRTSIQDMNFRYADITL